MAADQGNARWPTILASFILGVLAGIGVVQDDRTVPRIREAYVIYVDEAGTGIAVVDKPGAEVSGEGYAIGLAWWRREGEATWHSNRFQPTCVQIGQRVRLGVVRIKPPHAPGTAFVAWLECLRQEDQHGIVGPS